jgi:hypothetical protein
MLSINVVDSEELHILSTLQHITTDSGVTQPAFLVSGWVRAKLFNTECFDFEVVCFKNDFETYKAKIINSFDPANNFNSPFTTQRVIKARAKHLDSTPSVVMRLQGASKKKFKLSLRILEGDELLSDAISRDFTINAIYFDIGKRTFLDLFNGADDLQNGLLRSIQKAEVMFSNGTNLIFRLLEFSVIYKLSIHAEILDFFERTDCLSRIFLPALNDNPLLFFSSSRKFFCKAQVSEMMRLASKVNITDMFLLNFHSRPLFWNLFALVPNLIDQFDQISFTRHKPLINSKYKDGQPPKSFVMKGRMFTIAFLFYPIQKSYALEFLRCFLYDNKKLPDNCERLLESLHKLVKQISTVELPLLLEEADKEQTDSIIKIIGDNCFDKCVWSFIFVCEAYLKVVKGPCTPLVK